MRTIIEIARLKEVERTVGLRKSRIYEMMREGEFPASIRLGKRAVGWDREDIQRWLAGRKAM